MLFVFCSTFFSFACMFPSLINKFQVFVVFIPPAISIISCNFKSIIVPESTILKQIIEGVCIWEMSDLIMKPILFPQHWRRCQFQAWERWWSWWWWHNYQGLRLQDRWGQGGRNRSTQFIRWEFISKTKAQNDKHGIETNNSIKVGLDDDVESLNAGASGSGSVAGAPNDEMIWPSMQDLNTRLRRVITSYQRNYKKEELKQQQKAKVSVIFIFHIVFVSIAKVIVPKVSKRFCFHSLFLTIISILVNFENQSILICGMHYYLKNRILYNFSWSSFPSGNHLKFLHVRNCWRIDTPVIFNSKSL